MRLTVQLLLTAVVILEAACSGEQASQAQNSAPKEDELVVFRAPDGRILTMSDLRGLSGSFQYEILGRSNVPAEAEALHIQATEAGAAGDYKNAVLLLEQASDLAPGWPYPVYDLAFTHLLMKDLDDARKSYRRTLELAPRGFFTAITALDALDRESKGDLPAGTYLSYLSLDWIDEPMKKREAIRQLSASVPNFAPIWKEQAVQVDTDVERLACIENGLAANPDSETRGILLINKALVMDRSGDHAGAVQLLGELALNPASTYATEHLAKVTLANLLTEP